MTGQDYWDSRNLPGSDGWSGGHSALPADARVCRADVCGDSNYAPVDGVSYAGDGLPAHWD